MRVYVGTYTAAQSEGIYICDYDRASGRLGVIHAAGSENPSFLALHPSGRALYAVNEKAAGELSAFTVDRGSGALRHTTTVSTHGSSPCHLCVHPAGDALFTANYGSGSVTTHLIGSDLKPQDALQVIRHEGSGPNPKRQKGPHAHSINVDPKGRFAYAPDLGIDRVMIYRIAEDRRLEPASQPWAQLAAGSGPRHFAFHPEAGIAYVINELGSTIVAFRRNDVTGALEELGSAPTLPKGFAGESSCADIHLDPTGRWLYGSNRGHDSIVVFATDRSGGLELVGHQGQGVRWPRNFALAPDGRFLLVANRHDNSVISFAVDASTGELAPTGLRTEMPEPVCILFDRAT
jgi:6-phosphogluconolactonase